MLQTLKKRVQLEIGKGKILEEVIKNNAITEGFSSFNGWITEKRIKTTIYKSLSKK